MYRYDEFDHKLADRVNQFRGQVERRVSGALSEDQFKPLRLMNGVYLQLHAYMLRVAIPYGTLRSEQMRMLAHIARKYDRGYGHFTTRQNIQYNWPALDKIPDLLDELACVEMHAIQTSGNCIRNAPPTNMPVPLKAKPKTRALSRKSSANGQPSIPNSPICRASSKSP